MLFVMNPIQLKLHKAFQKDKKKFFLIVICLMGEEIELQMQNYIHFNSHLIYRKRNGNYIYKIMFISHSV